MAENKLGGEMAGALGEKALDIAYDQVLEGIGLGEFTDKPEDYEPYFKRVMGKLSQIVGQLDQVQSSINNIQSGLSMLDVSLKEGERQQLITEYYETANIIGQQFGSFSSALTALNSGEQFRQEQGAQLMLKVLSTENMGEIEQALLNTANFLLGGAGMKGLFTLMEDALDTAHLVQIDPTKRQGATICGIKVPDSFAIFDCSISYTATINDMVVPFFRHAMATFTAGMILLEAGYTNTIQDSTLNKHHQNAGMVMKVIAGFWDQVTAESRLPYFEQLFRKHLSILDPSLRNENIWSSAFGTSPDPFDDGGLEYYHFDQAWKDWIAVRILIRDDDITGLGIQPGDYLRDSDELKGMCCIIPPDFQWNSEVEYVCIFNAFSNLAKKDYVRYYDYIGGGWKAKSRYWVPSLAKLVQYGEQPSALVALSAKLQQVLEPSSGRRGILYVKMTNDVNPGNITLCVRDALSAHAIWEADIEPGQAKEKVLTQLALGSRYQILISWPAKDYHNITPDTGGIRIAPDYTHMKNRDIRDWQAMGFGVNYTMTVEIQDGTLLRIGNDPQV